MRQVKQRMARVKLHVFLFHLKFVKIYFFYSFSPQTADFRKTSLSSIQIFEKIIKRTLSPKFFK